MVKRLGQGRFLPVIMTSVAGLCLSLLAASPGAARSDHHYMRHYTHHYVHHYTPSYAPVSSTWQPSAGFGPTSPGVSSILIDARSGAVISGRGEDVPRYPASLTKLMTLDLAFQALAQGRMSLDTQIPVSWHAQSVEPVKLGLVAGQTISIHDAILAMTTMSANDAATALGEYLGGGSELRCAEMMTARAHALGMAQTQFANASGLPNPAQVTTARDLAILARDIVLNYPQFQSFFEVTSFYYQGRPVYSNNQMLRSYAGATGMKTGYTDLARHNLVTSAMRNGRELIGVELHEPSWDASYAQMTAMLNTGFAGGTMAPGTALASNAAPRARPAQVISPAQIAALDRQRPAVFEEPHHRAMRAPVQRVAMGGHGAMPGGWVAQLGVYSHKTVARTEAVAARQMRGIGVARIAPLDHDGRTLWSAQLAGLSYHAAHETCDVLSAHGRSCLVLGPYTDHLAMLTADAGT